MVKSNVIEKIQIMRAFLIYIQLNQHSQSSPIPLKEGRIGLDLNQIAGFDFFLNLHFYVKIIEIWVPPFFMHNILSTTGVIDVYIQYIHSCNESS